jgi:hypothetical protein
VPVRAGSAPHQEPLVPGGHERSRPVCLNPRSQAIHADDLGTWNGKTAGSNPTSSTRPFRRSSGPTASTLARSWALEARSERTGASIPLTVGVGCRSRSGGLAAGELDGLEGVDDDDAGSAVDGLAVAQDVVVIAGDEGVVTGYTVGR